MSREQQQQRFMVSLSPPLLPSLPFAASNFFLLACIALHSHILTWPLTLGWKAPPPPSQAMNGGASWLSFLSPPRPAFRLGTCNSLTHHHHGSPPCPAGKFKRLFLTRKRRGAAKARPPCLGLPSPPLPSPPSQIMSRLAHRKICLPCFSASLRVQQGTGSSFSVIVIIHGTSFNSGLTHL